MSVSAARAVCQNNISCRKCFHVQKIKNHALSPCGSKNVEKGFIIRDKESKIEEAALVVDSIHRLQSLKFSVNRT